MEPSSSDLRGKDHRTSPWPSHFHRQEPGTQPVAYVLIFINSSRSQLVDMWSGRPFQAHHSFNHGFLN